MMNRFWVSGIAVFLIWGRLSSSAVNDPVRVSSPDAVCERESITDSILGFRDSHCSLHARYASFKFVGVTEGDEVSLQRALNTVHKNGDAYVAVLFYASWCPFSRVFRPGFSLLASLYPSIPHFAIEESSIRPSILSKYGVHGFPTFFLLNSTIRVRYHGSRKSGSLVDFYQDVTGIRSSSLEWTSLEEISVLSNHEKHDIIEQESCPFSWARSPENMLRQETYLALATAFVLLRLLYFLYPVLLRCAQSAWRTYIRNMSLFSLVDHLLFYLRRTIQQFKSPREPCKRSNLQEGAMNAGVWASKSLATVSIGDASSSRGVPICGSL